MIVGIDPGTTKSAVAVLCDGKAVTLTLENPKMLKYLCSLNDRYNFAIEMVASYGMPVGREVFETCVWIGRFIQALQPMPVEIVYRKDVKMHLCGTMKAKDGNIRQALIDLIGPQGTKKEPGPTYGIKGDEWAALGVAVTMAARIEA